MFHIKLLYNPSASTTVEDLPERTYDENLDDISSLIADVCDRLEDLAAVQFSVGGFGQTEWPVDVRCDLLTFIVQIDKVLMDLKTNTNVDISFPEQGLQRTIHILRLNGSSRLSCTSFGSWVPDVECVELNTSQLQAILGDVIKMFLAVSSTYCLSISKHPWFVEWKKKLENLLAE